MELSTLHAVGKELEREIAEAQEKLENLFRASFNIKLVTKDRLGSEFVEFTALQVEDDGKITIVIEAWKEKS